MYNLKITVGFCDSRFRLWAVPLGGTVHREGNHKSPFGLPEMRAKVINISRLANRLLLHLKGKMPSQEGESKRQEKKQEENEGKNVIPIPITLAAILIIDYARRLSTVMPHDSEASETRTQQQLSVIQG